MKPQQEKLKSIMGGGDLINEVSSRKAIVAPLSEKEIDILMEATGILNDLRISEDEIDEIYSTLKNLREIPDNNEYKDSEFFHSYADRLAEARENYIHNLSENSNTRRSWLSSLRMVGSRSARAEKQILDEIALKNYKRSLVIAESHRNDLFNYAYAAVLDYRERGGPWFHWPLLMEDFGENNELYHRYGP